MGASLLAPLETQVSAILDAAHVVHRRLGSGWEKSVYLQVLEIVLVDRGVATAHCSLPIVRSGATRATRREGLLCDRKTWVYVEGGFLSAPELRPALLVTRIDHAVLLRLTTTGVEFRIVYRDGTVNASAHTTQLPDAELATVD